MTSGWIHTAYAWGLLALLVPLAIHLWNRKQGKLVRVGSVQLISPSESARASRLRLHELLLWGVRSALVAALVALLVGWHTPSPAPAPAAVRTWTLVDPAIADRLPDELLQPAHYWLASEPMPTSEPMPPPAPMGWPALVALGQGPQRPDTVVVYTALTSARWPAPAPPLPFVVHWKPIPAETAYTLAQPYGRWQAQADEYTVTLHAQEPRTTSVVPVYLQLPPNEKEHLARALALIGQAQNITFTPTDSLAQAQWVFWWGDTLPALPDTVQWVQYQYQPGTRWWTPDAHQPQGYRWHLPLLPGQVSSGLWDRVPLVLMDLMLPQPEVAVPMPAPATTAPAPSPQPRHMEARLGLWLLLVALLVITERTLAAWRKA